MRKNDWILVNNQLPSTRKPCVLYNPRYGIFHGLYDGDTWYEDVGTSCGCCADALKPTHWMYEEVEPPVEEIENNLDIKK